MKRAAIFLLLGPLSGLLAALLLELPGLLRTGPAGSPAGVGITVIFGYVAGIVPAIILGFVDWLVAGRKHRIAIVAGVAFLIVSVGIFMLIGSSFVWVTVIAAMLAGLVGAIPAMVCSWLLSEKA